MSERMSIHEVTAYLGVTRQRVDQIRTRTGSDFPLPVQDEPIGPRRWDRAEVEAWAEREWWGRYSWRTRP